MKGIHKLVTVATKILQIFHIVGAALMAAATVCAAIAPQYLGNFVAFDAKDCCGAELEVYGFEIHAPVVDGMVDKTTFILFGMGASLLLVLMTVVFHHLHWIFKSSENRTPFHPETIRRMKAIGFLTIAVPLVGLLMSAIIRLVTGLETVEISLNLGGILTGILVLCLTQFFVHGAALENDVDGLL
ncbi:MAG: hypothetical protein E7618_08490 [Ruminococcaceae bacterium]|nr:hypothetical protein [Oscillospiraceae bacterium]